MFPSKHHVVAGGLLLAVAVYGLTACHRCGRVDVVEAEPARQPEPGSWTLTIVGTNDFHGQLKRFPTFASHVKELRMARQSDGGKLLLLDAGDMFQGTLESNMVEGHSVLEAYNALGYDAAAVGNHEFDYGPVGPDVKVTQPGQDPLGALRARARQAQFPFLLANMERAETGARLQLPNTYPSILLEHRGVSIGVIGVTTIDTPHTTLADNVRGLRMRPLAATIERHARALRQRGAAVIVVSAHAGGHCEDFRDPTDLSSCREYEEIFRVARKLPRDLVDVIIGGHTHRGVAHWVNGIAVVEAHARARAFSRVDLHLSSAAPGEEANNGQTVLTRTEIFPPTSICVQGDPAPCHGPSAPPDPVLTEVVKPFLQNAQRESSVPLGPVLQSPIRSTYDNEGPLGNLITDMVRAEFPRADLAVMNAGGIRTDLPVGPVTYGDVYDVYPFENNFAEIQMSGDEVRALFASNLTSRGGFLFVSGIQVDASCQGGELQVTLKKRDGSIISGDTRLILITNDYLAGRSHGGFHGALKSGRVTLHEGVPIRDSLVRQFRHMGGNLTGPEYPGWNPREPRVRYPGARPIQCRSQQQLRENPISE